MKKLFTIALALVLTCSLAACGCQGPEPVIPSTAPSTAATTAPATTAPVTVPTTRPTETTVPMTDPTAGTNIPDPEVDPNSSDPTLQDPSETTGETRVEGSDTARSRRGM